MITAFLGYVLPIGQISYWGSAVITNLLAVIPLWGHSLVTLIWGGPVVRFVTLNRFFSFHFVLPFFIAGVRIIHLVFLHEKGSRNPLGLFVRNAKVKFVDLFSWKDLAGCVLVLISISFVSLYFPFIFIDAENFIRANSTVTPIHIQPEWYFLFAYAILRRIPRKPAGVLGLVLSVMVFYLFPVVILRKTGLKGNTFSPLTKYLFIWFLVIIVVLTGLGACPAEGIYTKLGLLYTKNYFRWFFFYFSCLKSWERGF